MIDYVSAEVSRYDEELTKGRRLWIAALMEMEPGKKFYPDANSTMRLSYGTIQDYDPRDAVTYKYYTTIDGVVAKSVKNGSPIFGPMTAGSGSYEFFNNYGNFSDYNPGVSDGDDLDFKISRRYFWETSLDLDLENIWILDEVSKTVLLKDYIFKNIILLR